MSTARWRRNLAPRPFPPELLVPKLLAWYRDEGRVLPWRTGAKGGDRGAGRDGRPDPYRVWLSEVMLQQTAVATVIPYFQAFVSRWPGVHGLAASGLDAVLHAWQGLGYYARARNLHACARVVSGALDGRFPESEAALLKLPGIGPYTAAAIAAIAFDRPATVVDGNVERVIARLYGVGEALPGARSRLKALAAGLTPPARAGDYAQAVMDLGAMICTPRRPACGGCPWRAACAARALGAAEDLPRRTPKTARPTRRGVVFWAERSDGAVFLRKRPLRGLLGGLMEFPSTDWRAAAWTHGEAATAAPFPCERWTEVPGMIHHGFTHFRLEMTVLAGRVDAPVDACADGGVWAPPERFGDFAFAAVMRKIAAHVLAWRGEPSGRDSVLGGRQPSPVTAR